MCIRDSYTVSRERALELIAEHQQAVANKVLRTFPGSAIQVLNGRFGPYITCLLYTSRCV